MHIFMGNLCKSLLHIKCPGPAMAKNQPRAINQIQPIWLPPTLSFSRLLCFSPGFSESCHYQEVISRQIDAGGFPCVNTSTANLIAGRVGVCLRA